MRTYKASLSKFIPLPSHFLHCKSQRLHNALKDVMSSLLTSPQSPYTAFYRLTSAPSLMYETSSNSAAHTESNKTVLPQYAHPAAPLLLQIFTELVP